MSSRVCGPTVASRWTWSSIFGYTLFLLPGAPEREPERSEHPDNPDGDRSGPGGDHLAARRRQLVEVAQERDHEREHEHEPHRDAEAGDGEPPPAVLVLEPHHDREAADDGRSGCDRPRLGQPEVEDVAREH